jgi:hypothetical protein
VITCVEARHRNTGNARWSGNATRRARPAVCARQRATYDHRRYFVDSPGQSCRRSIKPIAPRGPRTLAMVQGNAAFRTNTSRGCGKLSWTLARFEKISNLDPEFESTSIVFTCSGSVTVGSYRPVFISALQLFEFWGSIFI